MYVFDLIRLLRNITTVVFISKTWPFLVYYKSAKFFHSLAFLLLILRVLPDRTDTRRSYSFYRLSKKNATSACSSLQHPTHIPVKFFVKNYSYIFFYIIGQIKTTILHISIFNVSFLNDCSTVR